MIAFICIKYNTYKFLIQAFLCKSKKYFHHASKTVNILTKMKVSNTMSLKERFVSFIEKKDKTQAQKDAEQRGAFYSRAYHKYFEGYTEFYETDSRGKKKLRHIYTGCYYVQRLTYPQRIFLRIIYSVLFIISYILYSFSATRNIALNYAWYVSIFSALCVPVYFWLLMRLIVYIFSPHKMKIYTYKSTSLIIKKTSFYLMILLGLSCISSFIFELVNNSFSKENIICLLQLACSFGCMSALRVIENHVEYDIEVNKAKAPANGFVIEE